jgi:tRNA(fMet)-specific endonuclease VapC
MVVLDTDHMSFLERSAGSESLRLREQLANTPPAEVATTIITFEEQRRGSQAGRLWPR